MTTIFRTSQPPNILFSYKAQVDDGADEDSVSMPHQIYRSVNRNSDPMDHAQIQHPEGASFDSTHFDAQNQNPLYHSTNADLTMSFESDYFGQTPDGNSVGYMPPPAGDSRLKELSKFPPPDDGSTSINA